MMLKIILKKFKKYYSNVFFNRGLCNRLGVNWGFPHNHPFFSMTPILTATAANKHG
jgi:hypothetical protein